MLHKKEVRIYQPLKFHDVELAAARSGRLTQIRRLDTKADRFQVGDTLDLDDHMMFTIIDVFTQYMHDMTREQAIACGAQYMSFRYTKDNKPIGPQVEPLDGMGSYIYGYQVMWETMYPGISHHFNPFQVVYVLHRSTPAGA